MEVVMHPSLSYLWEKCYPLFSLSMWMAATPRGSGDRTAHGKSPHTQNGIPKTLYLGFRLWEWKRDLEPSYNFIVLLGQWAR